MWQLASPACCLDAMIITLAGDHVHLASNVGLTGFQVEFGTRSQIYDLRGTFYWLNRSIVNVKNCCLWSGLRITFSERKIVNPHYAKLSRRLSKIKIFRAAEYWQRWFSGMRFILLSTT
jgi:hypothetical protein